ncbi:hypothetical protein HY414_02715 [Candidatus Kaiserbacteria bacterium]|nr:hypothetical protein [Candidatus Kaiserbacteria bacterium]
MKNRMDQIQRKTPAFRTMEALLADTTFMRHIRSDEERITNNTGKSSLLEEQRTAHAKTLQNIKRQFDTLSDAEQNRFKSLCEERLRILRSIQPADERTADSDGKESIKRLKDVEYLGEILGLGEG